MKTLNEYASALTEAKKVRKLTNFELASRTGLSLQAVRQILAGETAPRLTNAMALADELGFELVLMPTEAAHSLAAPPKGKPTVVSNIDRIVGQAIAKAAKNERFGK